MNGIEALTYSDFGDVEFDSYNMVPVEDLKKELEVESTCFQQNFALDKFCLKLSDWKQ